MWAEPQAQEMGCAQLTGEGRRIAQARLWAHAGWKEMWARESHQMGLHWRKARSGRSLMLCRSPLQDAKSWVHPSHEEVLLWECHQRMELVVEVSNVVVWLYHLERGMYSHGIERHER
ncbi:unnamed protein product [Linum trigynum]|uniref:Uncharacterized protein n=1 Tax=Linum trigynum TaxID=586398 RepID=A0AAV2DC77_9ROSI